ncbi:MAG: RsmE family RNA methyltransferase [Verrucomicrobiota bacterium]
MNLILFEPTEIDRPLARTDRRAQHILNVLRLAVGGTFDAALVNGPRGKATLTTLSADALTLHFAWPAPAHGNLSSIGSIASIEPTTVEPITLIVGLPRPQTARDILRDATTLGLVALHFVRTDKAESSYAQSSLWSSGEWRRHLLTGAEQAFDPRVPEVTYGKPLAEILATLPATPATPPLPATTLATRIVLDNYESPKPLGKFQFPLSLPPTPASPFATAFSLALASATPLILALGAERGWSAAERDLFRAHHFAFAHLGPRVLRTETAVIAALAIIRAKLGLM